MTKLDGIIIQKIKTSYERGVPINEIAVTYGVSRQLVSKYARKYAWIKNLSKKFSSLNSIVLLKILLPMCNFIPKLTIFS